MTTQTRTLLAALLMGGASLFPIQYSVAADDSPTEAPAAAPEAGTPHPPTNRMDSAVPEMKGPSGTEEHPPTGRVGAAVPPMKPGDKAQPGPSTQVPPPADETTKTPAQ